MKRLERLGDIPEGLLAALRGWQATVWTALPGIIQSVNFAKMTCEIQPTTQARVQAVDGSYSWVNLPLLVDCPLMFPNGGGFMLTFPVTKGDEALIIFSSRCMDAWWQLGGIQVQAEIRMHDLSDGFVLPGPRSQPRVFSSISPDSVQLKNDAATSLIEIQADGDILVVTPGQAIVQANTAEITATSGITLNGNVTINGTLHTTGNITAVPWVNATGDTVPPHHHIAVNGGAEDTTGPLLP